MSVKLEATAEQFRLDGTHHFVDRICRLSTLLEHLDRAQPNGGLVFTEPTRALLREVLAAEHGRSFQALKFLAEDENKTREQRERDALPHWEITHAPQATAGDAASTAFSHVAKDRVTGYAQTVKKNGKKRPKARRPTHG